MSRFIPYLVIALLIWIFFFSHTFRPLGRWLGRRSGELRDAGREILDGDEVKNSPIARYENEVGKTMTARVLSEHSLSDDMHLQDRVYRIGHELAAQAGRQQLNYRFAVLEDPIPYALSLPGGSVFVTSALARLCGADDDRLAGVIGHEIAHIDQRHILKSTATRAATHGILRFVPLLRGGLVRSLSGRVEALIEQGFSEEREIEADVEGSRLAKRSGYAPLGLCEFLKDLSDLRPDPELPSGEYLKYFQSHPQPARRIRALEEKWRSS